MRWWLAALVACGSSSEPVVEKPPEPAVAAKSLSRDRADRFAKEFATAWTECRYKPLIAYDAIVDRAVTKRPTPGLDPAQLARDLGAPPKEPCPPQLREPGVASHLTTRMVEGMPRPIIRLVAEADGLVGSEYFELELEERAGGIRAVDFYTYSNGEWFSDTVVAILAGVETADPAAGDLMKEAGNLLRAGRYAESAATYEKLPESLRTTKRVSLMYLAVLARVDGDRFVAGAEAFAKKYPGDPSVDVLGIRAVGLTGRHEAVKRAIDRIDNRVGGDPFLDTMRALTAQVAGDQEAAQRMIARSIERAPEILASWKIRLSLDVEHGRTSDARKHVAALRARFGDAAVDELLADPRFSSLAKPPR